MDHNAGAWWGKRVLVEVVVAVEAGLRGQSWLASGGTEEVQCDVCLRHQQVPFAQRELGVAGCEAGAGMVFPCLDGSFGRVAAMDVGRHSLEINVVFVERFFEFVRAFVVEDEQLWCVAVGLQLGEKLGPCLCEFLCLVGLQWLGEDVIAVIIVHIMT